MLWSTFWNCNFQEGVNLNVDVQVLKENFFIFAQGIKQFYLNNVETLKDWTMDSKLFSKYLNLFFTVRLSKSLFNFVQLARFQCSEIKSLRKKHMLFLQSESSVWDQNFISRIGSKQLTWYTGKGRFNNW